MEACDAFRFPGLIHPFFLEAIMRRALCLALLILASAISGGCYVTQDANGQWWACEDYQTPNGPTTACSPVNLF
jgi:hypothetical protein